MISFVEAGLKFVFFCIVHGVITDGIYIILGQCYAVINTWTSTQHSLILYKIGGVSMGVIQMRGVAKKFNGIPLLEDVMLDIHRGTICGLIGHNGSGKSVLMKMMCGLLFPDRGTVVVDDQEIGAGRKRFPAGIGIVIDKPAYMPNKTGFDNLKHLAMILNRIDDQKIIDTMERLGLQANLSQKVKHYSLGMKQKLAIAQAIMEDQHILILDEPFNGLDQDSVANVRQLILDKKKAGATILLSSHQREDIELLCDYVFKINNCKVALCS